MGSAPMTYVRFLVPALAILAMATPIAFGAPAMAQRQERVLNVYGKDPCPTSNGEEIVVCRRLPEGERYRIPEELRKTEGRANETWGDRAGTLEYVGKSGTNSCSASGAGGASGCHRKLVRKACEEDKADGKKCGINF